MLLSEVLYLAKNLKPVNEAYKSKTIRDILKNLDRTSLNLNVEYISTQNVSWRFPDALDAWDIKNKYKKLYANGELKQELLDNPKLREALFNIKYVPKKKYTNTYGDYTFIVKLLKQITDKTGNYVGISEIKDSDLVNITPEEAKKKPYKSGLQFWFDYNDNIKAICKDNKIIVLFVKQNDWLESNPDYTGPTDMSMFKNSYSYEDEQRIYKEFVDKAFRKIPVYKLKYSNNDIKDELGANNIKTLQEKGHVYKVLAVNEEGQKNSDYNKKIEQRLDYKKYLNSQKKIVYNSYKNIKKINNDLIEKLKARKSPEIGNKVLQTLDEAYDTIFDVYTEMQTFMMQYLSNLENYKFENYYYINNIDITMHYKYHGLKNIIPENISSWNKGTQRRKNIRTEYKVKNLGDAFIIINYYLELLLNDLQNLTDKLNLLTKMQEDKEDKSAILQQLNYIRTLYKNFFDQLNYENDFVLSQTISKLQKVNIDPTTILDKLLQITPKI